MCSTIATFKTRCAVCGRAFTFEGTVENGLGGKTPLCSEECEIQWENPEQHNPNYHTEEHPEN